MLKEATSDKVVALPEPPPRKQRRLVLLLCGLALLLGGAREAGRVILGNNFHVIQPGKVYRGAQPGAGDIEDLVNHYHIRTVVNLRGTCDPFDWYLEESKTTQKLQVCQEDVCLSAGRLPPQAEIERLLEVLDRAEYPIFFHCRRGADRTGLASAIYLLMKTDAGLSLARRQLSLRYGHVALGRPANLDDFLNRYEAWLAEHQRQHTPAHFRHWLLHEYRSGGLQYRIEEVSGTTGPLRVGQPAGLRVRVRNTGSRTWPLRPDSRAGVKLACLLRDDRDQVVANDFWGLFNAEVPPGQAIDLTVVLPGFPGTGRYRLLLDMVDRDLVWFYQMGSDPFEKELEVRE